MRRSTKLIGLFSGLSLLALGAVNSSAFMKRAEMFYEMCGVERWSVKTGTDADVSKINLSAPTATTIAAMIAFPAQSSPPANNRVAPYETTLWTLDATLVEFKAETDDDYHLVLKDAAGNTMIAEIPAPSCVASNSPLLAGVTNARAQFDAKYNASSSFTTVNIPVRVQGVGMFDFAHGQTGAAPNQIELHPVISIIFNPGSGGNPPPAPTSLTATAGTGKVSLAWTASAGAATYNIYRSNSAGTETSYVSGLTAANYADSGVTAGTTYYYKVTAINASGESAKSNEASATPTSAGSAPAAPTSLSATAGNTQIALAWTASAGATSYNVYRSNVSGSETSYRTNLTSTGFTDTGLSNGTMYFYQVTAVNSIGESPKSSETSAIPTSGTGGTTQLLGNPGFESGATIWTAASGVIDNGTSEAAHTGSYKAWMCGYGSAHTDTLYQQVAIPAGSTSAVLTFWLHIDTAETSATAANDTMQVQIRNSSGTVLTTLASYSNLDANTGYALQTFDVSAYIGQTIQVYLTASENSSLQTSFVLDDFALNAGSGGGTVPAAPTGLSATVGNAQVALAWSASAGATSYNVYRSNSTGTETSYRTGLISTSLTDTGLTNGTAYFYKVTAVNGVGESAKSSEANATPTSGGTAQQLLGNPGFENGATATPWVVGAGVIDNGTKEAAHSGAWKAFLCGHGTTHTDTLYQTVTIPSTITTAALTLWLHIDTAETTTSTVYDTLKVQIRNSSGTVLATLATYSNLNAATGYTQKSFNVAAYKGQTIEVYLVGAEDSTLQTSFVVDDFALNVQ